VVVALALIGAVVMNMADNTDRQHVDAAQTDTTRTINVSGEGRVSLPPDVVMLSLGVDMRKETLDEAQSEAAKAMDAVIASLKQNGIDEKDIQTSTYSIYVDRDYNQPNQPIIGYSVTQTVTAKVRNIDNAGTVIQSAVDAGANLVNNVWFALENQDAAIKQAREQAVGNARAKAEELARLTGSTLGAVQTISEGYTPPSTPIPYAADMTTGGAESKAMAPTINPGQTEVVVSVSISYAIQ
jgi:uncharacterized protein YggE